VTRIQTAQQNINKGAACLHQTICL